MAEQTNTTKQYPILRDFLDAICCEDTGELRYRGYTLIAHHEQEPLDHTKALALIDAMLDVAITDGNKHHVIASFRIANLTGAALNAYLDLLPLP